MKKTLCMIVIALLAVALLAGCTQQSASVETASESASEVVESSAAADTAAAPASEAAASGKKIIGFIIAGPDQYYQTNYDTFSKAASENEGWETLFLNSEWTFEKELANVEDLIQKKVDAIVLQTNNAEGVLEACKKSLDAGIPFYMIAGSPVPSEIVPTCVVEGNWGVAGTNAAVKINEVYPEGCKVAIIGGVSGQTVDGAITDGFEAKIKELGANIEIVFNQPGDWQREKAMNVMQDLIASKVEYDVLFCYNEDMSDGALQIMNEANAKKPIVTCNGKDIGQAMVKDGDVLCTTEFAPTKEGYLMYLAVKNNFEGKTVAKNIPNAGVLLTKENIDEAIPWDVDTFFNEYLNKIWDPVAEIVPYIS